MNGLINDLKSDTSSIKCGMTGILSKSMYDFMRRGIVGKSSSCNFILQRPNEASMSSCVWPTIKKNTNTSLKMPLATNNDQKQNTYRHLSSLAQLSSCTCRVGGKGLARTGCSGGSCSEDRHTSFPSSTAS